MANHQYRDGKAAILPDSEPVLNEIVKLLQQDPGLKLRVEGHTDNQGNAAANQSLSEKRAQAVVAWLAGHGVRAGQLTAKGLGQTQPGRRGNQRSLKAKKNGDLEKNPLWQGFSPGLLSSIVPEDLEFRAQVCSPWMQDGGSLEFGQTNCLSSPNNLLSYG